VCYCRQHSTFIVRTMPFSIPDPPKKIEPALFSPRGPHLATRLWFPSNGQCKAICLIVSGETMHCGYFEGLAGRLNRDGIVCVAYDMVSTGYSECEPDAPPGKGYFHVEKMEAWIDDIFTAAVWSTERVRASDETPLYFLGESLGGIQVLAAALDRKIHERYDVKVSGVIALGALIEPGPGLLPSAFLIKLLSLFSPCFRQLKMPAPENIPNFDDTFGNKEWALTARSDPAVQISARPTLAAALSMINCSEKVVSNAKTFPYPVLLVHAVNDSRAVFSATQKFVDQVGSNAEGFWIQNTTGHQLLQDHREVTERVKNKVAEWIVNQIKLRG